jgi:CIC family chloride channel protein
MERARRIGGALLRRAASPVPLAILVGLGAGLGAVAFRWLIYAIQRLFFGGSAHLFPSLGLLRVIPLPAIGGLLVGLLTYYLAREARGHGVPEVMLAVVAQGGRIRPRVAVVKSLASAVCIGSGGSAGREGPIVQIGSGLGSTLGQVLHLPEGTLRLLVACGAAGGIAATFNAPISGVLFASEIILRRFETRALGFIVLSSVAATAVARSVWGDARPFVVPPYQLVSAWEFPLYALLGLICVGAALLLVRVLYGLEDVFSRWRTREYVKPAVGGLLVGLIGFIHPKIFGVGYGPQPIGPPLGGLELALLGRISLGLAIAYAALKLLATSLTIGSGGSGGIFSPCLFIGAATANAFGQIVHRLLPAYTAAAGAYALVGMGAVFAGAAQAPLTAIIIIFEMTRDYRIILPIMTAAVISTLVAHHVSRDTIYTLKIRRRGIDISAPSPEVG